MRILNIFKNIFKLSYFTDSYANPDFALLWWLAGFFGLLLLVTIFFHWRLGKLGKQWSGDRKFWWTHGFNMGYTLSIVSLIHLFFRYENMPYFNWRLWPALLVLGLLGWGGYLVYYRYKVQPKKQIDRETKKSLAYYFRKRRKS